MICRNREKLILYNRRIVIRVVAHVKWSYAICVIMYGQKNLTDIYLFIYDDFILFYFTKLSANGD